MSEAAHLAAAIATASAYIVAGDPVDVACRDAAEEHGGLNPRLVQNRLLQGAGATVETIRDKLRAAHAAATQATQANAQADRAKRVADCQRWAREFRYVPGAEAAVGKSFTYNGETFLFVAGVRVRGGHARFYAVRDRDGERRQLTPTDATALRVLREVIPAQVFAAAARVSF